MLARALLSFLIILPGVFGFVVPWWIIAGAATHGPGWPLLGTVLTGCGLLVLLWCVHDFYVAGRGTLAPWDPPRRLVVVGLYRFSRNPMYLGVLTLVLGWSVLAGSWGVAVYWCVLALGFHLRTIWYEERRLAELFGVDWERYRAAVPRWRPRLTPWTG